MASEPVSTAQALITLTLAKFREEMATMGPAAKDAAKDMGTAILKGLKDIEKATKATSAAAAAESKKAADEAAKAAKKTGKSWNDVAKNMQSNQMISDLEQLGSMFILVGGGVSKMAMLFTSAVRPVAMLAEILGPQALLALGLAAIPLAALGVVKAIKAMADSGIEARNHLQELGYQFAPDQVDALKSYEHAVKQLDVTMSRIKVSVGEQAAPAIDKFTTALNVLARSAQGQLAGGDQSRLFGVLPLPGDPVFDGMRWMRERTLEVSDGMLTLANAVATLGGTYGFSWLMEKLGAATDEEIALREESYRLADSQLKASQDAGKLAAQLKENADWASKATEAYTALGMMVSVQEEEKAATDAARVAREAATEAARAHEEQVRAMIAAVEFQANQELVLNTILMDQERIYAEKAKTRQEALKEEQFAAEMFEIETLAMIDKNNDKVADYMAKRAEILRDAWMDIADQGLSAAGTLTDAIVDGYERRAAEGEKLSDKEKTLAGLAYGLSQSFAATQAIMQAASMAIGMAAQMAPYAGPAAPGIAAALAGAMLTAQLASIAAAPPPEFPMGGLTSPDHHLVGVRGDEGILTARGLRNVGGEEGLDTLNGGGTLASADGPETVRQLKRIADALQPTRGPGIIRASRGRRT